MAYNFTTTTNPTYKSYHSMKQRCYNPKETAYPCLKRTTLYQRLNVYGWSTEEALTSRRVKS